MHQMSDMKPGAVKESAAENVLYNQWHAGTGKARKARRNAIITERSATS